MGTAWWDMQNRVFDTPEKWVKKMNKDFLKIILLIFDDFFQNFALPSMLQFEKSSNMEKDWGENEEIPCSTLVFNPF